MSKRSHVFFTKERHPGLNRDNTLSQAITGLSPLCNLIAEFSRIIAILVCRIAFAFDLTFGYSKCSRERDLFNEQFLIACKEFLITRLRLCGRQGDTPKITDRAGKNYLCRLHVVYTIHCDFCLH